MILTKQSIQVLESTHCVEVEDMKAQLLLPHDLHNVYISRLIQVAIKHVERDTRRKLQCHMCTSTYKIQGCDYVYLDYGEADIQYIIDTSTQQHIDAAKYLFTPRNSKLILDCEYLNRHNINEIQVQYLCGYKSADVPVDLVHAIKMFCAGLYQTRSDLTSESLKKAVICSDTLLKKYKLF